MTETRRRMRRLLHKWGSTAEYCDKLQREMKELQERAEEFDGITAVVLDGMPRGSKPGDPTGRLAMQAAQLKEQYIDQMAYLTQKCDEAMRFKRSIDDILDELPRVQRKIIELKYEQGWQWTYIALKMFFSVAHVKKMEGDALDTLAGMVKIET